MDISTRIAELEALKTNGQISQQEFDVLISIAREQGVESLGKKLDSSQTNSLEIPTSETASLFSTSSLKKGLIVIAAIVLLIFALRTTRQGDPLESEAYKQLLQQKEKLLAVKTDLESKLEQIDDWTADIIRRNLRVKALNDLGITE